MKSKGFLVAELFIALVYFIGFSTTSDCSENATMVEKIGETYYDYQRQRYETRTVTVIESIRITCNDVVWPISFLKNYECNDCPQYMVIKNSNLTTVPSSSFLQFSYLTTIDMANQQIKQLVPGAFNSLNSLKQINLAGNLITKIRAGVFNSLYKLESLDVSRNEINDLEEHSLTGLIKLQLLNISHNNLLVFEGSILDNNITTLTFLDLSFNNISRFDSLSTNVENINLSNNVLDTIHFCPPLQMRTLSLRKNRIRTLKNTSCPHLFYNLLELDLSFNEISELDSVFFIASAKHSIEDTNLTNNVLDTINSCPPNQLNKLSLSNNRIISLKNDNCSNSFSNLRDLDLSFNDISELDSVFFVSPNNNLEILSLTHNNISIIPTGFFSNLNNLVTLNLSYNGLEQFQHGTFDTLVHLSILDISHNNLKDIKRYLHSLSSLTELYINQNKIVYLNSKQLVEDLPALSKISIANNNWSCENLINLIHDFRRNKISFEYGRTKNTSNIHGISCFENVDSENTVTTPIGYLENINAEFEKIIMNKLGHFTSDQDFRKSAMYAYFNNDFKNSNFYKYMENLQKLNAFKFNETQIFNYFDRDFENTKFFKYLESLKTEQVSNNNFNNAIKNYFNSEFKNSNFVKYLNELEKADDIVNVGFTKSVMYNFFNEDFENSKFYKYLMSLQKTPQIFKTDITSSQNYSSRYEKLTNNDSPESSNLNNKILLSMIFILIILIIICINSVLKTYLKWNNSNKIFRHSDQVEMIEA